MIGATICWPGSSQRCSSAETASARMQWLALVEQGHRAGVTVDGDQTAAGDPLCRVAGAHDGWDAVFPGEDGAVGGDAPNVGDQAARLAEQRGPRGRGRWADEYSVGPHRGEVCRRQDNAGGGGDAAWADG